MAELKTVERQEATHLVAYQANYDKETQHKIEETLAKLVGSISGYCTEIGSMTITDPIAVGNIVGELQKVLTMMQQLYDKYEEDPRFILECEKNLEDVFVLDGVNTIAIIKYLNRISVRDIAVKHKLMDKIEVREPWETNKKK
jgi:hypothetical protein